MSSLEISDNGAGVVCIVGSDVILVQMNYGKFKGQWILPGGMVEKGEFPHQAAIREFKEETGKAVDLMGLLTVRYRIKKGANSNTYWIFVGDLPRGTSMDFEWDSEELLEVRLWPIKEALDSNDVRPHTKEYMKMALEKRRRIVPQKDLSPDFCY